MHAHQFNVKAVPLPPCRGQGGEDVKLLFIFYLGTRWGWAVSFTPRPRFTSGKDKGTHWIEGWVGLRAGLDTEAKEKILCICRGSNLGRPVCSQTLNWRSYPSSYKLSIEKHEITLFLLHIHLVYSVSKMITKYCHLGWTGTRMALCPGSGVLVSAGSALRHFAGGLVVKLRHTNSSLRNGVTPVYHNKTVE
jgi:hypothetical protein